MMDWIHNSLASLATVKAAPAVAARAESIIQQIAAGWQSYLVTPLVPDLPGDLKMARMTVDPPAVSFESMDPELLRMCATVSDRRVQLKLMPTGDVAYERTLGGEASQGSSPAESPEVWVGLFRWVACGSQN